MKRQIFIAFLLLLSVKLVPQPNMQRDSSIVVKIAGNTLKFPWAGGLNFTNWGIIDLNNDGFKDLVVYDKSGSKMRTFINDGVSGQPNYTHNAVYENKFPFVSDWFATYDYNCDGLEDIFTHDYPGSNAGIRVFKNVGNLQFVQMGDNLVSDYGPHFYPNNMLNIPNNGIGVPGLVDMDHDGDMDIIAFDIYAYNVEYHKNLSMENFGNCDNLVFMRADSCWGEFNEGLCQVTLDVCTYSGRHSSPDTVSKTMHAGSVLTCFDADGDGLIDLVEGDLSCDSVFFMSNKGVPNDAHITSFTSAYPPSKPIAMSIFPCTYFIDVNNDNKRDLIASPSTTGSEDYNNQWMYINTGADNSPNFNYVKNNFLQENMIDLGEGAYPTLFDYEGDGDLDLLVGNFAYYNPLGDTSKIAFFKNVGTTTVPSFSLITNNFANLSSLNLWNMAPTTGDLDGDGDVDLLIGDNLGKFHYFTNTGGVGHPAVFSSVATADFNTGFLYQIRAGTNKSYPQLIDLDKDGKLDIVSGAGSGKIFYFRNTGTTTTPTFSLITNFLGDINVTQICNNVGQSVPFVFTYNGSYKMLIGSECGNMYLYDVPSPANLNNPSMFTLVNSNAFSINDGEHIAPVLFDLNNDTHLDLMLGNYSGGLTFYKGLSTAYNDIAEHLVNSDITIFPNPGSDVLNVKFNSSVVSSKKLQLIDLSGRTVKEISCRDNQTQLSISEFADGIYFLNIQIFNSDNSLQNNFTQKIIISHE